MKQVIFLGESKSPLIASLGRSRVTVMRWLWNRRERKKLGLQGWVTAPRSFGETQKQKTLIKLCCSPHCQVSRSLVARMEDSRTLLHTQMTRVHTHTHAHTLQRWRIGEHPPAILLPPRGKWRPPKARPWAFPACSAVCSQTQRLTLS